MILLDDNVNKGLHHLNVTIIVQARMGASRLPGKPMKEVLGKPLLFYLIDRLKRCQMVDSIVVATTDSAQDIVIGNFAKSQGVEVVFGEEKNVLARYGKAARLKGSDVIVRITADCPLMDPEVIDKMLEEFLLKNLHLDYLSNTLNRTFPRGLDIEIFTKEALEKAIKEAKTSEEQEHVTPYFYRHPEIFRLKNFSYCENVSDYRWTVDTSEDFELIKKMIEALYPINPKFTLENMLALLKQHPEWKELNRHVEQKK